MTVRDWIGSPQEWGAWGRKATAWFNELAVAVRAVTILPDTGFVYAAGVVNFGGLYQVPNAMKMANGTVYLEGLITNATGGILPAATAVLQLPADYAPRASDTYWCDVNGVGGRVDVLANGQILVQAAWPNGGYMSISGITFLAANP